MNKADELRQLVASGVLHIPPAKAAYFLNADPQLIRWYARHDPGKLDYPIIRSGTYTKIPLVPFARKLLGEEALI